tara:strand:- start:136 stop:249 length:114 start_codon:yes stop_codon:yes gene_type:complete
MDEVEVLAQTKIAIFFLIGILQLIFVIRYCVDTKTLG